MTLVLGATLRFIDFDVDLPMTLSPFDAARKGDTLCERPRSP
jgi:hypothetical protein